VILSYRTSYYRNRKYTLLCFIALSVLTAAELTFMHGLRQPNRFQQQFIISSLFDDNFRITFNFAANMRSLFQNSLKFFIIGINDYFACDEIDGA